MKHVLDVNSIGSNGIIEHTGLADYVEVVESCQYVDVIIALISGLPHRRMVWNASVEVGDGVFVHGDVMACLWLLELASVQLDIDPKSKFGIRLAAFRAFGKFKENLVGSENSPIVEWTGHQATNQRLGVAVLSLMHKLRPGSKTIPPGFKTFFEKDDKPLKMLRQACVNLYSDTCYRDNLQLSCAEGFRIRLRQCLLDHNLFEELEKVHCSGEQQGNSFAHETAQDLANHALSTIRGFAPWEIEHSPAGDSLELLRDRRTLAGLQQQMCKISNQSDFGESQAQKGKDMLRLLMALDSVITKASCEPEPAGSGWWNQS